MEKNFRVLAHEMIMAGVNVADPRQAIKEHVKLQGTELTIDGKDTFNLKDYNRVLLFGIGKASTPMCQAMEQFIKPDGGLAITKRGAEIGIAALKHIPVYTAFHPEPRQENIDYSQMILDMVDAISPNEKVLVFLMISGGGSALFEAPPPGVSIDDMFVLNQLLMKCGATIHEINTIRRHVSQVKGGRFGKRVTERGAHLVSLILSDVVGDDLAVIASGPSYKDPSSSREAIKELQRFKIWDETPEAIRRHLEKGLTDSSQEPPKEVPPGVFNYLIGSNLSALYAAKAVADKKGLKTMILTSQNTGEAKIVAKCVMGIAKEIQDSGNPMQPPAVLIMGGEMIVTFNWEDRDGFGPAREFVLSSALEISGRRNIVVAGVDSDGEDGDGKAGAIADGQTIARSKLDPYFHLHKHEAEVFFDALGDSIEFTSMTNVNDILVVLVGPKE